MFENLRVPRNATHFVLRDNIRPDGDGFTTQVTVMWMKNTSLGWMFLTTHGWRAVETNIVDHHLLPEPTPLP